MSLYLGLDVGTQGTKGLVLDLEAGAVVARASRSYGLLEGLPPGAAEQHPDTWWEAVRDVVRELAAAPGVDVRALAGLGVSGQQHGLVALDAEDRVLRPAKLWCDTTTAEEARELSSALGRPVPAGYTAPKLLWMKRREPEHFARLARVLLPHDWIDLRLTGEAWMEAGDASGTGFLDPRERCFDPAALAAVDADLVRAFPSLVPADRPAATVARSAAEELGLPAGLPVAPGAGDNMASAIGSGAVRPGVVTLSLGTSGTVFAHAAEPVVDPTGAVAPFCDSTGGWLPLVCVMNATGVLEEVRAASGLDLDALTALAEDEPVGAGGLLLLPYLAGERVPDLPEATGTLLGIRAGSLAPGRLFRAALEGTALGLAGGVECLRELGLEVRELRLVGGGARNPLWRRILCAATGARVQRLAEPESAALGAALQAAWCVTGNDLAQLTAHVVRPEGDALEPEEGDRRAYAELRERFLAERRKLHGV